MDFLSVPVKGLSHTLLLVFLVFLLSDCRQEDTNSDSGLINVRVRIKHLAGGKLLVKDQFAFQNAFSQPYAIQSLDYYLSNFKLRNPSQQEFFAEVGSYHLVNALLN
jgi:hypothetical protein